MKGAVATLALLVAVSAAKAQSPRPFDPTLDPVFQLAHARSQALREHKRLLLDVGGNWCIGCLLLERLIDRDPNLSRLLSANYVLVHVNVSPDNLNASFMSRFPRPTGYPFLIVVDPQTGKVVHAQGGLALQRGAKPAQGYEAAPVAQFFERWRATAR